MMHPIKRTKITAVLMMALAVILTACKNNSLDSSSDVEHEFPFVIRMPEEAVLESDYKPITHDLSPLSNYHFNILIPKRWEVLDANLTAEPTSGNFGELGVFREPGEWMRDELATPLGEISFSLVSPVDKNQSPSDWLSELVAKNLTDLSIIEERTFGSGADEAGDVLFRYNNNGVAYVMRAAAFRLGDNIVLYNCSDTLNGYRDNAQACFVALSTFKLRAFPDANFFRDKS